MNKIPNPVDRHVGARVRMQRVVLGITQEKLGEALGLTFQQIQKYEKGANRISASRLQQIAQVLAVPVAFFFQGIPTHDVEAGGAEARPNADLLTDFLATSDGVTLTKAFLSIKDASVRRRIVDLVETLGQRGI